jgi:ferrochelatase
MARIAVVLFNLGGPDGPEAVRPFLVNLFSDPAILRVPAALRPILARLIAGRRAAEARRIYALIGGGSPILAETRKQAAAVAASLAREPDTYEVFVAMRYWHPMTEEAVAQVKRFGADRIVLLPLYPQFSTSTTASSVAAWRSAARKVGLDAPTVSICCYPTEAGFVAALARLSRAAIAEASAHGVPRVLFSAHGLPKKFVALGDPYADQVERCVAQAVAALAMPALDFAVCYQSRIGPLEWLRPYTADEIERAAAAKRPIVVVPVAFVSEHSETLVELDIDYRERAAKLGAPVYVRAPTVGTDADYVAALARLARAAAGAAQGTVMSGAERRLCDARWTACPFRAA